MPIRLSCLLFGGGFSSLLRHIPSSIIQKQSASLFPYGILIVNLIEAALIGFLWGLFQNINVSTNLRVFIFMGIIGAFTTFPTFSLETFNLLKGRQYITALINVVVNNVFCIILVFAGFITARFLIK